MTLAKRKYEIKEGAFEEFVSWVDSNSAKYPASADLEEMRTKTTKDDMTDSDRKGATVSWTRPSTSRERVRRF